MKIHTTLQRSVTHEQFCEDCLAVYLPTEEDWLIAVVSDGCSSGQDSHFASSLTCKIVRKVVQEVQLADDTTPQGFALDILHGFMAELKRTQECLKLESIELLATLVLMVHYIPSNQTFFTLLGDGLVVINNEIYEYDQKNVPDYPAYHLEDTKDELQQYFLKQTKATSNSQHIGISSDGVLALVNMKNPETEPDKAIEYLLVDNQLINTENMLSRKCNILQKQQGFVFVDDISIIRVTL